jgi:hypothetical protein
MQVRCCNLAALTVSTLLVCSAFQLKAQSNLVIYDDALENGFQNWGWAVLNYVNTSPVHSGSDSISVTITNGYIGIQIVNPTQVDSTPYTNITFWLNGGSSGGQHLQAYGLLDVTNNPATAQPPRVALANPTANTWTQYTVSLSSLGVANAANFTGFVIQDSANSAEPTFYMDDITLVAGSGSSSNPPSSTNALAAITVDANANRHAISPLIYGVAFASQAQLADLNAPINRSGGNAETRYNWQTNAHNRAADFYFESIGDGSGAGSYADSFISSTKAGGAQPGITIPMIGWAPKLGAGGAKLASYSIAKYGPQTGNDATYFPDAGNGISVTNSTHITWNDPNDANFPVNVAFQQGWVQHLTNTWGVSTNSGVQYYFMDNEHSLWFSTHQDIHPVGPTMQEIYSDMTNYAGMVKSLDPHALVLGPEEWGWSGYFYSGFDQQWSGAHGDFNPAHYPDRGTNGGMDYMPWLLNQLHLHDTATGVRLLDYFTLHCYPQEGSVGGSATDSATQMLRNQTTRQFWDTSYVDPSWINSTIYLIPRMKSWVATYYPGTKIGVTEYNWGAEPNIGGATAQADLDGIFGREGLDLATRWTTPDASTPTYLAMKMYRNYDGSKSTFGDTSVSASGPNPDNVAVFGAVRSTDGALTVMVVSKYLGGVTPVAVTLTNFKAAGTSQVWQLNSSNVIAHLPNTTLTNNTITATVPGQSVTLFVLAQQPFVTLAAGPARTDGKFQITLTGQSGQTWITQSSPDMVSWSPVSTNTLSGTTTNILVPAGASKAFYRAHTP